MLYSVKQIFATALINLMDIFQFIVLFKHIPTSTLVAHVVIKLQKTENISVSVYAIIQTTVRDL